MMQNLLILFLADRDALRATGSIFGAKIITTRETGILKGLTVTLALSGSIINHYV